MRTLSRALVALGVLAAGATTVVAVLPRFGDEAPAGSPRQPATSTNLAAAPVGDGLHADSAGGDVDPGASARAADSARAARADSLRAARDPRRIHADALAARGLRILVSLDERRLFALDGADTVRVARVGIGMDSTIVYRGRVWNFRTPRGVRRVLGKETDPLWIPPDWHYVEVARERGLRLERLRTDGPTLLDDSSQIVVDNGDVGLVRPGVPFTPFAPDEEVIWKGTLYIPPIGTRQREVVGELGRFRLDLGEGYLIHGTPHTESVGEPSSHGCMRLADDDIAWLYEHVPVGTPVYTY